jgi:purine-binding chemotaxis protein CheW
VEFIKGVGKLEERLIILLNIDRILSIEEKVELERLERTALSPERESVPTA